ILSLSAHTLHGVLKDIEQVAELTGRRQQGAALVDDLRRRIAVVQRRALPSPPPRVLALEWLDPFFQGGHWIPELIAVAGGVPVLAEGGQKSVRFTFEQLQAADPDIIVVMPCGYHLPETVDQYNSVSFPAGWRNLR